MAKGFFLTEGYLGHILCWLKKIILFRNIFKEKLETYDGKSSRQKKTC